VYDKHKKHTEEYKKNSTVQQNTDKLNMEIKKKKKKDSELGGHGGATITGGGTIIPMMGGTSRGKPDFDEYKYFSVNQALYVIPINIRH
jgi:hypothetical protein